MLGLEYNTDPCKIRETFTLENNKPTKIAQIMNGDFMLTWKMFPSNINCMQIPFIYTFHIYCNFSYKVLVKVY